MASLADGAAESTSPASATGHPALGPTADCRGGASVRTVATGSTAACWKLSSVGTRRSTGIGIGASALLKASPGCLVAKRETAGRSCGAPTVETCPADGSPLAGALGVALGTRPMASDAITGAGAGPSNAPSTGTGGMPETSGESAGTDDISPGASRTLSATATMVCPVSAPAETKPILPRQMAAGSTLGIPSAWVCMTCAPPPTGAGSATATGTTIRPDASISVSSSSAGSDLFSSPSAGPQQDGAPACGSVMGDPISGRNSARKPAPDPPGSRGGSTRWTGIAPPLRTGIHWKRSLICHPILRHDTCIPHKPLRFLYGPVAGLRNSDRIEEIAMTQLAALPPGPAADLRAADRTAELRAVARELEASFLAEMLKYSGLGATSESFGGGAGEDQFASLLRAEHARALADRGGIGLAESLFRALAARDAAAGRGTE